MFLIATLARQIRVSLHLPPDIDDPFILLIQLLTIVVVIGDAAAYGYLRGLARRVPNDAIARRAGQLRIAAPILAGLSLLWSTVYFLAMIADRRGAIPPVVYGCSSLLLIAAELVLTAFSFSLLQELRNKIESQARVAQRFWAAHEG